MSTDVTARWLTARDVADTLQLRDLRSARVVMLELGAARIGGRLRLPPGALDDLVGRERIQTGAAKDHRPHEPFTRTHRPTRDPSCQVPAALAPGWLDSE